MSNFHVIGTGCCGFLRAYDMFKNYLPITYKGGKRKYQNGFEVWDSSSGLIWDSESLSEEERMRRVSIKDKVSDITHSLLPYVSEFITLDPSVKFLCLRGERSHSIKSLLTSWGYRNPCFVKDRSLGVGKNRYPVDQFPDFSFCKDEMEATEKFWDLYYERSEDLQKKYPNNFLVVDSIRFFGEEEYQKESLSFFGIQIPFYFSPVNTESFNISTTLHGGLGNNLFQMAEVISFCSKYNLPNPFFGTWDLLDNNIFPPFYNSDRFLGGHEGTPDDIKNLFPRLDWRENLKAEFDTKFMINDMFRFGEIEDLKPILEVLGISSEKKNLASLHFRFCTRPADDHVNGVVDEFFYQRVFELIPKNIDVLVFSDDYEKAKVEIQKLESRTARKFVLFYGDPFQCLKEMSSCEYNILHVSTFSFWAPLLGKEQIPNWGEKVFCPSSFIRAHGDKMISPCLGWNII